MSDFVEPEENKPNLYDIPIEVLHLSEATIAIIKRTGITSVGDCLDYFARGANAVITARGDFIGTMENVVKPKLKENGYLPSDDTEV
jgi:hypothetical protein